MASPTEAAGVGGPALDSVVPVLTLDGVGVSFGTKLVLSDIDIQVRAGEFICVVGPSGAGKTTLIRCITGLLRPTSGTIALSGEVVSGPPQAMALVSQDYSRSLMPWLKIGSNVALPLRGKGISKREIAERVGAALESVGLSGVQNSYPWQLSGGMQQRVSIARALAFRPQVLVMDEPFASVDAQTRSDLEDLVLELQRTAGITIVLVTHDIDESVYLGDRVLILGGHPTNVIDEVPVPLGRERDQLSTKSSETFLRCRADVLRGVKR